MSNNCTRLWRSLYLHHRTAVPNHDIPIFLCPLLGRLRGYSARPYSLARRNGPRPTSTPWAERRALHSSSVVVPQDSQEVSAETFLQLPRQCPGCGALSHIADEQEPGFYALSRRSVREYIAPDGGNPLAAKKAKESAVYQEVLKKTSAELHESLTIDPPTGGRVASGELPLCDRCHRLIHHQSGTPIHHPSIESLQDTISESDHKYNHVYHVIDAADFPMSLIPGLYRLLHLSPQRSLNRRSKAGKYIHGRRTDVSFVITRADLLAPLRSQVDSLMPVLTRILREALGSAGRDVRLGNVRCVSAKAGWWIKVLKEEIWTRGGGGWLVGKVNVGKSQLFQSVFPKGRRGVLPLVNNAPAEVTDSDGSATSIMDNIHPRNDNQSRLQAVENQVSGTNSLLPPLQPEVDYPTMPIVSSLPGTTASPIRVPFGNGRGELVDLPGLSRGGLEACVQEAYRPALVMQSRTVPEQQVLHHGRSLLLGGFIRITPTNPDMIILAYAFTSLYPHVTNTEKSIKIQTQQITKEVVKNIANPGVGATIKSAGIFALDHDVTKQRSGPVTASDGVGMKVDQLPYRVFARDILIEGCGWVELVAQVRARNVYGSGSGTNPEYPTVEVFSPNGSFIGSRQSLGAWLMGRPKEKKRLPRPRKSMKGHKKSSKSLRAPNKA